MNHPNEPTNPHPDPHTDPHTDTAWEAAMSRDFDARVRDLHEAPLDFDSVKGKAHRIRRNRRAAVAGGILGVAAVITPLAVLTNSGGESRSREPDVADNPPTQAVETGPEYLLGRDWHQADGDVVGLDRTYDSATIWGDQLVATSFDGGTFAVADVIDAEGSVVRSFETTGSVAVTEDGSTIAWVGTDGSVLTDGPGGELSLGTVPASGDATAWQVAAVTGGPDCNEEADACVVYLNSNLGEESRAFSSHGTNDIVAPGVTKVFDAADGRVSVIDEVTEFLDTCGGLLDSAGGSLLWRTCDYQVQQIAPNQEHVAAPPSQYDGNGPTSISILDATDGEETGRYAPEGGFVGEWGWTGEDKLLFTAYDGANWHLISMEPDGEFAEIGDQVEGNDVDSPFVLVRR